MTGLGWGSLIAQGIGTGLQIGSALADTRISVPNMMVSGVGQPGFYYTDPGTGRYIPGLRAASAARQAYIEDMQALYATRTSELTATEERKQGSANVGQARVRAGRGNVVSSGSAQDIQLSAAMEGELKALMARYEGRIASDLHVAGAQLAEYDRLLAEASYVAPYERYNSGNWFGGYFNQGSFSGRGPDYASALGALVGGASGGAATYTNPSFASPSTNPGMGTNVPSAPAPQP